MWNFILLGCGTENPEPKVYFHPPAWIQGYWVSPDDSMNGFKFTNDDVIVINSGKAFSKKEFYHTADSMENNIYSVKEIFGNLSYELTFKELLQPDWGYKFRYVDSTHLDWTYDKYYMDSTKYYIRK